MQQLNTRPQLAELLPLTAARAAFEERRTIVVEKPAYQALGISQTLFVALCFENHIRFIPPADARQTANKKKAIECRAKRDQLTPRVAEYAHLGILACAALLKFSDGQVRRIARENGIAMKGMQ
ncbi:hypothetical protein [Pseudomonas nitroreducens]|uniref:hypothetical protein n=1 Tax=Pseudomonas nitroreducens TaxID=46680 RepID=UPI00265B5A5B|nr:hypothetical protein [Pseudomonas nitroreducens]MCP1651555.1 hypothetical protein [Pseudomonas nitroreducens]MCP1684579.1 hypothetical protein [Pseudomonas nitroreducens]